MLEGCGMLMAGRVFRSVRNLRHVDLRVGDQRRVDVDIGV